MKKLLLLATLFLGSCTMFFYVDTPSENLISLINGKTGTFMIGWDTYGFTISSNAEKYTEPDGTTLSYSDGSDTSATYEGSVYYYSYGYLYSHYAKVVLSSLTHYGGVYTLYIDGYRKISTRFSWASYNSVDESSPLSAIKMKALEDK